MATRLAAAHKERDFLKALSDNVMADQKAFRERLTAAERQAEEKGVKVAELEEQVSDTLSY